MRFVSLRAVALFFGLAATPALADHVNSEPTLVTRTSPEQSLDVSRMLDHLVEAGLKDATPGAVEETYSVGEFLFEAVLIDGVPYSRQLGYRSEGLWHRSGELNDADSNFAYAVAEGKLQGAKFNCSIGYVLPLLACTRGHNNPATAKCEMNYRCISVD